MTKEVYFQMCEDMGTEPVPEQIPVELDEFLDITKDVIYIFSLLPDRYGEMSGVYMGKDMSGLNNLFKLFDVDERNWLLYIEILQVCIKEYTELIAAKSEAAKSKVNVKKDK